MCLAQRSLIHPRTIPQGAALIGVFAQCRSSSVIFSWPGDPPAKADTMMMFDGDDDGGGDGDGDGDEDDEDGR